MNGHPWCRDVARDEAVRRAEDAAAVPEIQHRDLPAAVEALTERVGRLEAVTTQPAPVPPADGLRTERITLEVTHDCAYPASEWVLEVVQDACTDPGESVRVVEEAAEIVRLTAERDAALRERDAARAEAEDAKEECERLREQMVIRCTTAANLRGVIRERDQKIGTLEARVTELESAAKLAPAANAGGEAKPEPVAWAALRDDGDIAWIGYTPEGAADGACGRKIVPLYAAPVAESATTPPEPRGWLTAEEREAAMTLISCGEQSEDVGDQHAAATIRSLLERLN